MPEVSAGILLFTKEPELQLLLAHPGGPYWQNKDEGAWSIPKGLIEKDEDKLEAAVREFQEEVNLKPAGDFLELGSIKQKGGKVVFAWAVESERSANNDFEIESNTFTLEWPPNTGKMQEFPEIDRAEFFSLEQAYQKINEAQRTFLDRLIQKIDTA
ncbi:MAG: NUDIX domain-containing protein [Balneolaceae bacterium]|nr:NUDIX domain-containing protein [Balneolaceae bacterium]